MLLPLTFHRSDGLNEIDLARLGSQRSRPVLDHPPVENPLDRRGRVSQDPALQRGVGALDGLHRGGDDVDKMLSKKFKPPVDGLQPVVGALRRRLDVVVVVVRETVAEPWRLDL